ncbi:hypothetical protein PVK06_012154 [Gossypium arboreum]|uniref:Uncharacterized protein n=1 Tax=Gossypium arboreum TaxID=29729 RepID=A0ABR0QAT3_GOSAR|nr:hypothetical protein PVK06_012154 [Gossypium arboreum]
MCFGIFFKGFSSNGWRQGDSREVAEAVGTARGFESYLEKATHLSHKIKEVMNLRASLRDMHKNHRIDAGPVNVVISSEEKISITESSSGAKKPSLSKLTLSLQVRLAEATMVSLGLSENVSRAEASQRVLEEIKEELERTRELYLKMREENE